VAIGVVFWIQGNLIVGDYGVLNGEAIDWSGHAWRNRYEPLLWIGLPAAAVVFAVERSLGQRTCPARRQTTPRKRTDAYLAGAGVRVLVDQNTPS
jgi:hypothetical protein